MLRISTYFQHCSGCVKCCDSASVSAARMMWIYKGDVNWALGENSKETFSLTILTDASFNDDTNKGTLNVNKFCQQL